MMKAITRLTIMLVVAGAAPARAADICEAVALRDIAALESPTSILRRGERDEAVTQYRVNKKTGEASFCSHGGSCYPASVTENGRKVEALRLTNCKVGTRDPYDDPDEVFYQLDVIRPLVDPVRLRVDDVDNRLLELGLCSACASNVAYFYVHSPASRCARLAGQALEGNPQALATLRDFPDYCTASK